MEQSATASASSRDTRNLQETKIFIKKERIAVSGIPSHRYGTSLAIWDHTVLPATRHK